MNRIAPSSTPQPAAEPAPDFALSVTVPVPESAPNEPANQIFTENDVAISQGFLGQAIGTGNWILGNARLQLEAAPVWVGAVAETALWPTVMVGALMAADVQYDMGLPEPWIAGSVLFGSLGAVAMAERLLPVRPQDNEQDPKEIQLNLLNIAFSETLFPLVTLLPLANLAREATLETKLWSLLPHTQIAEELVTSGLLLSGPAAWVESAADFSAALLIAEFANYWSHRLSHMVPLLWPVHFIHHTAETLTATAAGRSHPLNIWLAFAGAAWLKLLGAPEETIVMTLVASSAMAYLQHANARMRLGFLGKIFIGPEIHRLHHSRDPKHFDKNFGMVLTVWDRVFGTFMADDTPRTGVSERSPKTYFEQLAYPFEKWAEMLRCFANKKPVI